MSNTTDEREGVNRLGSVTPLQPGDPRRVGRYVLLGRLGAGGMGSVYLGRLAEPPDATLPAAAAGLTAVKVVHRELAEDPAFRARFADEVAAARRVAPFCTARVLDADPAGDPPYLATEYVDGVPLGRAVLDGGPLDDSTLQGVALGVAAALAAIHGAGVVHRDLKPGNVLLSLSGPRVIDFGIARAMDVAAGHTQAGTILGTPGWMAPEQFRGGHVGPAADVFSWGSLVAYAATGRNPWGVDGPPAALAYRIIHGQPDVGGLRGPLRALVEAALRKDPARRPTARDLVLSLLAGGTATPNPGADPTVAASHLLQRTWAAPPAGASGAGRARSTVGSPTGAAVPPPRAAARPRPAVLPPRTAVLPPRTAVLSPRTAVVPPRTAVLPPRTAVAPPHPAPPRWRRAARRLTPAPHQLPPPYRRPRRRWYRKRRYLIPLGLLALLLVGSSRRPQQNGTGSSLPGSGSPAGAHPAAARPQIGVPVRDGQLEFVLRSWRCGVPEIGHGIWSHRAHGQYCLADLQVRNIGNDSRTLFEPLLELYDTDGNRHDADAKGRFYLGDQALWDSVDPGQTVTGTAPFDIPAGSHPDHLELHDGLLSGGTRLLL